MSQHPKRTTIRLTLSPAAEKYARRDAPLAARRMAAKGALPLQPIELATVLFALHHDPDAEVKETARASLQSLPENILRPVLQGPCHPALLSFLAHAHRENEASCEQLALNPACDDATLAFLASLSHRRVVEVISNNQQRMLDCEDIVEALGANPLTGRAVIERILNFLGCDAEAPTSDRDNSEDLEGEAAEALVLAMLGEGASDLARQLAAEGEEISDERVEGSLFSAVQNMSVLQKIKLARLGGSEARGLLIRDRNKIVAAAAITSPKVRENEVVSYAQSRNVCDEVLRIIASNREWTRSYQVKLSLVTNPKCPLSRAIQFLNYIQDRELKALVKSKDVPSAISSHARRILTKKGRM